MDIIQVVPGEDLFRLTLKNTSEDAQPTLIPEKLLNTDFKELIEQKDVFDIDYILIKHLCTDLFNNPYICTLLGDNRGKFFKKPFRESLNSKLVPKVYTIAEIGHYRVGIFCPEIADNENNSYESDKLISNDFTYQLLERKLKECGSFSSYLASFESIKEKFIEIFSDFELVVFCYGQKTNVKVLKQFIVNILSVSHYPIEVAIGRQVKLHGYFLGCNINKETSSGAYSNFLSNSLCNVLIKQTNLSAKIIPNSYRMCCYNTIQHDKRNINTTLIRKANTKCNTLYNFKDSFLQIFDSINSLISSVEMSSLRIEGYFCLNGIGDLHDAFESMQQLPKLIEIVKVPVLDIQERISMATFASRILFDNLRFSCDATSFYFLLFYDRLCSFVKSTDKINDSFIRKNYGMSLPSKYIEKSNLIPSASFFNDYTIPQIWGLLKNVFGEGSSSLDVRGFYFIQLMRIYPEHFLSTDIVIERCTKYLTECILNYEYDDIDSITSLKKFCVTFDEFSFYFEKRCSNNLFLLSLWNLLKSMFQNGNQIARGVVRILIDKEFKFVFCKKIYSLVSPGFRNDISYASFVEFIKNNSFRDILAIFDGYSHQQEAISSAELFTLSFFKRRFDAKIVEFGGIYLGKQFGSAEQVLVYDIRVLLKIIYTAVPKSNDPHFIETVKFVECFSNFDDLVLFCFLAILKYYQPKLNSGKLKKKRENYTRLFKVHESNYRWTFNSVIYFSGLFHSSHDNGTRISMPIPERIDLHPLEFSEAYDQLDVPDDEFIPSSNSRIQTLSASHLNRREIFYRLMSAFGDEDSGRRTLNDENEEN